MAVNEKKLRRLPKQGMIAGVCAGLAEYFEIDVTLVRLVFILLAVVTGGGMIIAYIIMALVIPADPTEVKTSDNKSVGLKHNAQVLSAEMHDSGKTDRMRNYLGAGIILLGIWLLLGQLFPGWFTLRWDFIWPVVLIIVGLIIATRRKG